MRMKACNTYRYSRHRTRWFDTLIWSRIVSMKWQRLLLLCRNLEMRSCWRERTSSSKTKWLTFSTCSVTDWDLAKAARSKIYYSMHRSALASLCLSSTQMCSKNRRLTGTGRTNSRRNIRLYTRSPAWRKLASSYHRRPKLKKKRRLTWIIYRRNSSWIDACRHQVARQWR